MSLPNLLDYNRAALIEFVRTLGEPDYRATQILQWIHTMGVNDFSRMTNLSLALRNRLQVEATLVLPEVTHCQVSRDGTRKWLLKLPCGDAIEMVFIPEESRGTLCISSQVGCAINCSFCATGKQGFSRNLSVGEIIGQLWIAARTLSEEEGRHDHHITNVVMMGMGEPLLNFDNVCKAMDIMMDDFAYGLSKRRVTLSTSGLIPEMNQLKEISPVALAVSLHAPNDELRNILVPINKKYPLAPLMAVCKDYFIDEPRRVVTFEYVMLKDINDKPEHAEQLIKLLRDVPAKVNLIPYNTIPGVDYVCSSMARINDFRETLMAAGINAIVRKTRGDDIAAACGQLVGEVTDKTRRAQRLKAKESVKE